MKSGQLEEKPKVQSAFVFQPSAASVEKSALPFSFGSSSSFTVADKGFSQLASNASEFKKEDETSFRGTLKTELNTSKPPAPVSQPAMLANTNTSNLFPKSNKNLVPEEKRMEPTVTSSSSILEHKQSSFAKQLTTTSLFDSSAISSTASKLPSTAASLSTSSNVFSGSSVFVKPKLHTADGQNLITSSISFQSSTSALTISEARTEQRLRNSVGPVVAPNPTSTSGPFILSKPVAHTFSSAASANNLSSSIVAGKLSSLASGSSQVEDASETSTMPKTTNSIVFGSRKELASETIAKVAEKPGGGPSSMPITSSLLGGQPFSSFSNTSANLNPARQGLFGQAGTASTLFGEKTVLSTASSQPMPQTITSSASPRSETVAASEILPSLTPKVTSAISTTLASGALSTSSFFGQQTTSSDATIQPFGNKAPESSISLFGSSVTLPSSSFSSANKLVVSDTTCSPSMSTETLATSSNLLNSKTNLATTSPATSSLGQSSLFATVTTQSSNATFSTSTASTKSSLFGAPLSSVETKGIFGSKVESSSGLFGQTANQKTSVFSISTQVTTSSSGNFGTASDSAPLLFGAQTTTKSSSIFGQTTSSAAPTFGNQQPSTVFVTQPSEETNVGLFRTPTTGQTTGGLFAPKSSVSSGRIFGNMNTDQASFGQGSPSTGPQQEASSSSGNRVLLFIY